MKSRRPEGLLSNRAGRGRCRFAAGPAAAVACAALVVWGLRAEGEEFRWKVAEGDMLTARLEQEISTTTTCSGQERRESSAASMVLAWEVVAADADTFTVRQKIESLSLSLSTPSQDGSGQIHVDGTGRSVQSGLAGALQKEIEALQGVEITAVYRTNGSLVSVAVDESSLEEIRSAPATSPLRMLLTREGLNQLFGRTQMVFPDRDLRPGDSWLGTESGGGDSAGGGASGTALQDPPLKWRYESRVRRDQRELHRFSGSLPAQPRGTAGDATQPARELAVQAECLFDAEAGIPHSATARSRAVVSSRYRDLVIETVAESTTTLAFSRN